MENQGHFEHSLGDSRMLKLELGAGIYQIQAGISDKIVVVYHTGTTRQLRRVKVSLTPGTQEDVLKIRSSTDFQATIEVPKSVGLSANLRTGTLEVKGVEGNKNFDVGTGMLKVDMVRQDHYASIDASVKIGQVDGGALGRFYSVGGSSLRKQGPGKYLLHAHVKVGNVLLY